MDKNSIRRRTILSIKTGLVFGLLAILFSILGCDFFDGRRDIKAFYFPMEKLAGKGLVYQFTPANADTTESEYWIIRAEQRDGKQLLITQLLNPDFTLAQTMTEAIFETGTLARSLVLFEPDSASGKPRAIVVFIEEASLFPFKVGDSTGVFLFKISYRPPSDSLSSIYLIRNRRFHGNAPDFLFKGEKIPCIAFKLKEVIGKEQEGSAEIEGSGEEIYGKGIGLVAYRKNFGSGLKMDFRLTDIFEMQEFGKRRETRDK